jgi:8-oxo-dGTP diphosphatase
VTYSYDYPHPAVTVDVLVFTVRDGNVELLLIKRAEWPHTGKWAIPGGFVEIDESLKRAALRELREETGVRAGVIEQLGAFGHPDRDPRERVITVAYIALVPFDRLHIEAGSDAAEAQLFGVDELPELAFDHDKIMRRARERLQDKLEIGDVAKLLMPAEFTLSELQKANETISGVPMDKRNFRKKVKSLGFLEATGGEKRDGAHRPAKLYHYVYATIGANSAVI